MADNPTVVFKKPGVVVEVGEGIDPSWKGRRVASHMGHSAYVKSLVQEVVPVHKDISDDQASFFTIAEIVMNGLRRSQVQWGEADVVFEVTGNQDLITKEFTPLKRQGRFVILSSPRSAMKTCPTS